LFADKARQHGILYLILDDDYGYFGMIMMDFRDGDCLLGYFDFFGILFVLFLL